jgi:hypothetical protein
VRLGLALSEKQTPQVVEKIEKPKEQIEGLESSVVLRRQTLYPTELRAHGVNFDSKPSAAERTLVLQTLSVSTTQMVQCGSELEPA